MCNVYKKKSLFCVYWFTYFTLNLNKFQFQYVIVDRNTSELWICAKAQMPQILQLLKAIKLINKFHNNALQNQKAVCLLGLQRYLHQVHCMLLPMLQQS